MLNPCPQEFPSTIAMRRDCCCRSASDRAADGPELSVGPASRDLAVEQMVQIAPRGDKDAAVLTVDAARFEAGQVVDREGGAQGPP